MQSRSVAMANVGETVAKYIGHKVAKVRWIPQVNGQLNPSETFVTGGWDDQASLVLVNSNCVLTVDDHDEQFSYFSLICFL